ncbi:hypothetical protein JCM8208_003715 [Rhodotorula glutinis]
MPSTYDCRTCGSSFSSGRVNWASPTCGPCEAAARAEQRRKGLAAARVAFVPSRAQLLPGLKAASRAALGRLRVQPVVPPMPPSGVYLDLADENGVIVPSSAAAARLAPLVVVLSPSDTLVYRLDQESRTEPVVRPYLSTLLAYLYRRRRQDHAALEPMSVREIRVVVFSAMHAKNVSLVLRRIGLEGDVRTVRMVEGTPAGDHVTATDAADDKPLLDLVLSRESMGLDKMDFWRDVITVKDLAIVWRELGLDAVEGTRTTVLVDESLQAAFPQPHSRLPIPTFGVADPASTIKSGSVRELAGTTFDDTALLSTIYYLELLTGEINVPAAFKSGLVRRAEEDAKREVREREGPGEGAEVSLYEVQEELARRGREVCAKYGVEVRREWDGQWSEKMRQGGASEGQASH